MREERGVDEGRCNSPINLIAVLVEAEKERLDVGIKGFDSIKFPLRTARSGTSCPVSWE